MKFIKDIDNRIEYAFAYVNDLNDIGIIVDAYTRRSMLEDINTSHKNLQLKGNIDAFLWTVFLWAPLER